MQAYNPGAHLGEWLGRRDPAHIDRWIRAQREGRRAMPKCEGVTSSGARCRQIPLRGQCRCRHHLREPEKRRQADLEREQRHRRTLARSVNVIELGRARRGLAALARRRLHQLWKVDPTAPGSTISFASPRDRERTCAWLIDHCAVDPDALLAPTGHLPTPRCLDRLLWAGWRIVRMNGKASPELIEKARLRVVVAIRDDAKHWRKIDGGA